MNLKNLFFNNGNPSSLSPQDTSNNKNGGNQPSLDAKTFEFSGKLEKSLDATWIMKSHGQETMVEEKKYGKFRLGSIEGKKREITFIADYINTAKRMCLDAANRDVPYYVSFGYHGISPDFYPTLILDPQIIGHELDHENLDNEDSDIISNTEEGRSLSIVDDSLLDGTPEARYITCHSSEIVSYLQEWIEQQGLPQLFS